MSAAGVSSWPRAATRLFGVLGHPVAHTLSPTFQNAAFRAAGLDACYLAFDVAPDALAAALAGARALGVAGLNLTVPHKEAALALVVEADPLAERAGAANTLVPVEGGWKAYNTDVGGLLRALALDLAFVPEGRRVLLVGAGGAARAAAVGLLDAGIQEIFVANRNKERADRLADRLVGLFPSARAETVEPGGVLPVPLSAGDLVVDATPAGLHGGAPWPWDLRELGAGFSVYDLAYRAGETSLVENARAAGFSASSGKRMLLHQGALAFSLWTGRAAPLGAMEEALNL